MTLSLTDYIVVALYFVLVLFIGFHSGHKERKSKHSEEFLLAGRRLTLPIFVATLVSTWYGSALGVGEFVYRDGLVAWVCFAFPYYLAAALFAIFIAKKIRDLKFKTIPDQMRARYGDKAALISSLIILILTIPAAYLLMLGIIIQLFVGWQLWICVAMGSVVSLIYLFSGGFRADVMTNTVQFIFMYVGFAVLTIFCILTYGAPADSISMLPARHLTLFGGYSWQFIVSWFIIAMQTFVDPSFHQRCAAAKTPATAQRGIAVSIFFWIIFDIMTLTCGLYARAHFVLDNPVSAYPVLSNAILPIFWKGLFVVSMLAVVMSTLDSYTFISGMTIGHDILAVIFKKKGNDESIKKLTRIGLAITSIVGIIMAVSIPSVVGITYKTASIGVPGLLFPMLLTYTKNYKLSQPKVIIAMIASSGTSLLYMIGSSYGIFTGTVLDNFEPMIPGILVSIILMVLFVKPTNGLKISNEQMKKMKVMNE
jgi:SSS family solute:Na+ symporter